MIIEEILKIQISFSRDFLNIGRSQVKKGECCNSLSNSWLGHSLGWHWSRAPLHQKGPTCQAASLVLVTVVSLKVPLGAIPSGDPRSLVSACYRWRQKGKAVFQNKDPLTCELCSCKRYIAPAGWVLWQPVLGKEVRPNVFLFLYLHVTIIYRREFSVMLSNWFCPGKHLWNNVSDYFLDRGQCHFRGFIIFTQSSFVISITP